MQQLGARTSVASLTSPDKLRCIQPYKRRNVAHRDVKGDNYLMDRKAEGL